MNVLLKKWWWQNSLALLSIFSGLNAQTFQNLVPNGSFETYTQCPTNAGQIFKAAPWTGPPSNSSDYNNSCASLMNVPHYGGVGSFYPYYLNAKDGNAYAGIYTYQLSNYREYLQVALVDTLNANYCYYVEFYAANYQAIKYKTNNIAANLSPISYPVNLTTGTLINVPMHITNYGNPVLEDTVKWKKISGVYEAAGNEKYLILGNFKDDSHTDTINIYPPSSSVYHNFTAAYIFVDAVSVYSIDPHGTLPWTYTDTTINEGDSANLGNEMGGMNFHPQWFKSNGTYITANASIVVSPTVTSKYVVQYTLCGVVRSDTIEVTVIPKSTVGINEWKAFNQALKIYPIPANDLITIENEYAKENERFTFGIQNGFGQIIRTEEIFFKNKRAIIKINDLQDGVYFLAIKNQANESVIKKMVVAK